jgi:photosystem II stability/assembly factor-like uncharacterized protein
MKTNHIATLVVLLAALGVPPAFSVVARSDVNALVKPAKAWARAEKSKLLASGRAGNRIVAVGEHGVVLLSDDGGIRFRQAGAVPIASTLTAVTFVDEKTGWAVGHWGVVLHTTDGGETWTRQRIHLESDQPLFSVQFSSAREGWAGGLWSLLLKTEDGGATWKEIKLPAPPDGAKADRNLNKIIRTKANTLLIACEGGTVLRSTDNGRNWVYVDVGQKASLWSAVSAPDGTVFAGGLRGALYRSNDDGKSWARLDTKTTASITDLAVNQSGLVAVGLEGLMLQGALGANAFAPTFREDRRALTSVLVNSQGKLVVFSKDGVAQR